MSTSKVWEARVTIGAATGARRVAPAALLGDNMEMMLGREEALSTNRLRNPKFLGPGDADTGVAPQWEPGYSKHYHDAYYAVARGVSLSGETSQLIAFQGKKKNRGLAQRDIWVRAGEKLNVQIWARCQHQAVALRVAIRPSSLQRGHYDEACLNVDTPHWHCYTATLTAPVDDERAVFTIYLEWPARVYIDQVYLGPAEPGQWRPEVEQAVGAVGTPVLRWVGGCESAAYRWTRGIGPVHLRPTTHDPIFKGIVTHEFGTGEYLEFCRRLQITPHITIPLATSTPEEIAEWAGWCAAWYRERGIDPPLMYWHIGNEVYGRWELGAMPVAMYVRTLRAFVPGIRQAYPRARILAIGIEHGQSDFPGYENWRQTVMKEAADLFDLLAIQYYPGWTHAPGSPNVFLYQAAAGLEKNVRAALNDVEAAKLEKAVALTEWSLWRDAASYNDFIEPSHTLHALFAADVWMRLARMGPRLELANYYHFGPVGLVQVEGGRVYVSEAGKVARLLRPMFPGAVVPVEVIAPELAPGIPAVDALCLEQSGGRWLVITNRSEQQEIRVTLVNAGEVSESVTLAGADLEGELAEVTAARDGDVLRLPPLSITRLKMR